MTAIPHAYLYGLAQKINEISTSTKDSEVSKSTKDNGIPQAILLALGVLHIPGEAKPYKVLGWSCLNSPQVGNSDFEYKVMVKMIVNYLRKRLQDASPLVEKKAKELWEGSSGMETRCAACMARGLLNTFPFLISIEELTGEICMYSGMGRTAGRRAKHQVLSQSRYENTIREIYTGYYPRRTPTPTPFLLPHSKKSQR